MGLSQLGQYKTRRAEERVRVRRGEEKNVELWDSCWTLAVATQRPCFPESRRQFYEKAAFASTARATNVFDTNCKQGSLLARLYCTWVAGHLVGKISVTKQGTLKKVLYTRNQRRFQRQPRIPEIYWVSTANIQEEEFEETPHQMKQKYTIALSNSAQFAVGL